MFGTILKFATRVLGEIPAIISIVETVKGIFKPEATGAEKHAAAVKVARNAILEMEEFSGKEIVDEDKFSAGLDKVISGSVDMMNAVKHNGD